MNNFVSNAIKTLGIPQNVYSDLLIGGIDHPTLGTIVKCRKYPSILAIKETCKKLKPFYLSYVMPEEVFKVTRKSDASKSSPGNIYPHKNSKGKCRYICKFYISIIVTSIFPAVLKLADLANCFLKNR